MLKTYKKTGQDYAAHAALMARISPNVAGWRGCAGIALVIDGEVRNPGLEKETTQAFVKNDDLAWVTAVDVPVPWMTGLTRPAHVMQIRKAALRYGAPVLDQATVTHEFDYWDGPAPDLADEFVAAANGINNAMTSTAFAFRYMWGKQGRLFAEYAGLPGVPTGEPPVILGERHYPASIVKDFGWVPRPWVEVDPRRAATAFQRLKELGYTDTFRTVATELFAVGMPVTSPVSGYFTGTSPVVVGGTRYTQFNFRETGGARHAVVTTARAKVTAAKGTAVFRGEKVGTDAPPVPTGYFDWSRDRQWGTLKRIYEPAALDLVLGNAFSAMFRQCEQAWLLPFEVIGADVSYSFGEGGLWWDVANIHSDAFDFSVPTPADAQVHIMPTMWMRQWDDFSSRLGAVATNLTPVSPNFAAHAIGRPVRKFPVVADGRTGDAPADVVPVAVVPGQPTGTLPPLGDEDRAAFVAAAKARAEWLSRGAQRHWPSMTTTLGVFTSHDDVVLPEQPAGELVR